MNPRQSFLATLKMTIDSLKAIRAKDNNANDVVLCAQEVYLMVDSAKDLTAEQLVSARESLQEAKQLVDALTNPSLRDQLTAKTRATFYDAIEDYLRPIPESLALPKSVMPIPSISPVVVAAPAAATSASSSHPVRDILHLSLLDDEKKVEPAPIMNFFHSEALPDTQSDQSANAILAAELQEEVPVLAPPPASALAELWHNKFTLLGLSLGCIAGIALGTLTLGVAPTGLAALAVYFGTVGAYGIGGAVINGVLGWMMDDALRPNVDARVLPPLKTSMPQKVAARKRHGDANSGAPKPAVLARRDVRACRDARVSGYLFPDQDNDEDDSLQPDSADETQQVVRPVARPRPQHAERATQDVKVSTHRNGLLARDTSRSSTPVDAATPFYLEVAIRRNY